MTTHIVLIDFTEQGIRDIKQSPTRATQFADAASRLGVEIEGLYWTSGVHDGVVLLHAPDDETLAALMLTVAQAGNVRSHTLRAFGRGEIDNILGKL